VPVVGQRTVEGNRPASPRKGSMREEESIETVRGNEKERVGGSTAQAMRADGGGIRKVLD
jgi:hypothetical protein